MLSYPEDAEDGHFRFQDDSDARDSGRIELRPPKSHVFFLQTMYALKIGTEFLYGSSRGLSQTLQGIDNRRNALAQKNPLNDI